MLHIRVLSNKADKEKKREEIVNVTNFSHSYSKNIDINKDINRK